MLNEKEAIFIKSVVERYAKLATDDAWLGFAKRAIKLIDRELADRETIDLVEEVALTVLNWDNTFEEIADALDINEDDLYKAQDYLNGKRLKLCSNCGEPTRVAMLDLDGTNLEEGKECTSDDCDWTGVL